MNGPPAAQWLARAYHEIRRGRHLVLDGALDDDVCWGDEWQPLRVALPDFLKVLDFRAVLRYDLLDGLTGDDPEDTAFLARITAPAASGGTASPSAAPPLPPAPGDAGAAPAGSRGARASDAQRALLERIQAAGQAEIRRPSDAWGAIHQLLSQGEAPCAVIVYDADLVFAAGAESEEDRRRSMARLRRILADAVTPPMPATPAGASAHGPLRNTVILVARQRRDVPAWVYEGNPHTAVVHIGTPTLDERAALLYDVVPRCLGSLTLDDDARRSLAGSLANLTDGMSVVELRALAATSQVSGISVTEPRRLVLRQSAGVTEDPWENLDLEKVADAAKILTRRVVGQPAAVDAVASVLGNARGGIGFGGEEGTAGQPKGVFFFVGPTGTGKTELAKALAQLVFDDESALRRFDMSEFGQEHTSERLTGAPPGFVGHEAGGVLTNWVRERPFSVLLFDEIEKAHPKVLDKFLQIIDDGRLTDGQGRTAYFAHTIVIFTSNLGAESLPTLVNEFDPGNPPRYELVDRHFRDAVTTFFTTGLGRPELLGRLGNGIVVFDILRAPVLADITVKFLDQLTASARSRGLHLIVDTPAIVEAVVAAVQRGSAALGAREIRSPLLEEWVRAPLNRWVIAHHPEPGTRIWIRRAPNEAGQARFVVERFPD